MAKIIQEELIFEINTEVNVNGWVDYTFNFLWDNKPIFNPEIMMDMPILGDELGEEKLVSVFELATDCRQDGEIFSWESDNPDIELNIKANMGLLEKGVDGYFDVEVFFNERQFIRRNKDNQGAYSSKPAGFRISPNRNELMEFSKKLREEYEASLDNAKKANPKFHFGFGT